jgi:hypothetical protein
MKKKTIEDDENENKDGGKNKKKSTLPARKNVNKKL